MTILNVYVRKSDEAVWLAYASLDVWDWTRELENVNSSNIANLKGEHWPVTLQRHHPRSSNSVSGEIKQFVQTLALFCTVF